MKKVLIACISTLGIVSNLMAEVKVGQKAPDFTLEDTNNAHQSLSQFKGKFVVLEWVNPDCPFVKKHYNSGNMQNLQKELRGKDVTWLSVCSSAKGKQGFYTGEEWNKMTLEKKAAPNAVLLDADGKVGKLYGAKTTPHMFVIDPNGILVYKGAIDDKPSTDIADVEGAKNYVKNALEETMAGKKAKVSQTQSYGCGVKYK